MKSIHDRPYYKKVYKKDSKNLKILIGHGSKQPKHAKKGAPYTKNPQKRRPVNKLSAPIIALDEAISEDFKTRFNEIKEATFVVKMKKKVDPYYVTILDKEKTYNGVIKDNNITITNTEKGPITKTKKEFLDKLAEYGELCNVVYCDNSTIKIGTKTLTFSEMLKPVEKKPEQPKKEGPIATRNKEQGAIVGSIADNVAKGKSIEKSVLDEFGHTAMGRRFAKGFAEAAGKALEESGLKGDTLKAAALTSVMMGMVARVPFDVIGTFTGQIPDDLIPEIANTLGPYLSTLAPVLEKLQGLKDDVDKAAATGEELLNQGKKGFERARRAAEKAFEFSSGLYVTQAEFWFAKFKMGRLKEDHPDSWPHIAKFWEEGTGRKGTTAITDGIKYGFLIAALGKNSEKTMGNKKIPQSFFTAENIEKFYNYYQRKYGANSLPLTLEQYKRKYTNASNIYGDSHWSAAFINYIMRDDGDFQKIVKKSGRGNHKSYWVPAREKTKSLLSNGKIDQAPWIYITAEQAKKIGWSDDEGIGKVGDIVMVPGPGYKEDNDKIHGDIKTPLGRIGGNVRDSVSKSRRKGVALVTKSIEAKLLLVKEYGTDTAKAEIEKYEDSSNTSSAIANVSSYTGQSRAEGDVELIKLNGKRGLKLPSGEIRAGGTLAWLNNNPGNIRYRRAWRREGAVGRAYGYATWATYEKGYAALKSYITRYGFKTNKTILSFMKEYAPESDNNKPRRYASFITERLKTKLGDDTITQDTRLSSFINNEAALEVFAQAIKQFEGYREGTIVPAQ